MKSTLTPYLFKFSRNNLNENFMLNIDIITESAAVLNAQFPVNSNVKPTLLEKLINDKPKIGLFLNTRDGPAFLKCNRVPRTRVPRFCIRIPNPAFLSKPFFFTKLCVPALPCSNFASRSCIAFLNGKLFEFLKQV